MQIIINIEDSTYDAINREYCVFPPQKGLLKVLWDAIKNGTPLPKGHGRIGDLDALENEMINGIKAGNLEEGYEEYANINNMNDCVQCVKYADTIIEADKAESEV